jgi:hypothetical protein
MFENFGCQTKYDKWEILNYYYCFFLISNFGLQPSEQQAAEAGNRTLPWETRYFKKLMNRRHID